MSFFFIQLSDPQFGLYATRTPGVTGFAYETGNFEKAIAAANRLRPAFVLTTGDLVQEPDDQSQVDEVKRIAGKLEAGIPMYWAAGNCDVGVTPTSEALSLHRARFGRDNYSFDYAGSHFIVLNSAVAYDPSLVPDEWRELLDFLRNDLQGARENDHIVVLMHHPLFGSQPEEEDSMMAIPLERRGVLLDLFGDYGVSAVFSGHWHANNYVSHGNIEMITSGPVGVPIGDDPSGLRVVKVHGQSIEHRYYGFDDLPDTVDLGS